MTKPLKNELPARPTINEAVYALSIVATAKRIIDAFIERRPPSAEDVSDFYCDYRDLDENICGGSLEIRSRELLSFRGELSNLFDNEDEQ